MSKIVYTRTDEAPALATYSFLPIIKAFAKTADIDIETKDISLAGRILANFADYLKEDQVQADALAELGELVKKPEANVIKLPNISASIPQLEAAIKELQAKGYKVPDYPEEVDTCEKKAIKVIYDKLKGSAVNPVLREGNSDRRAPKAVKNYAKKNPHSMGAWTKDSKTHVATMQQGDFRHNEKSVTFNSNDSLQIIYTDEKGNSTVLKDQVKVLKGEIADATFMSKRALLNFLEEQIADAKQKNILLSLHMKATMMKVSDPIIFGHAVRTYFKSVFDHYQNDFDSVGADLNNGLGNLLSEIKKLSEDKQKEILDALDQALINGPDLAMVDSDKGITNLHVPSDVIIDASMPAMIRTSGKMWNKEGKLQDTKAIIPDSSYAGLYQATIDFCKENGAFDPVTMGTVSNVGLMAQKAEEYGSHDKTFEISENGKVSVINTAGEEVISHDVEKGDIWRMCLVKDLPIQDWVKLAISRARATGWPIVFWLDENRPHDNQLIQKVNTYLPNHDTEGLTIEILSPENATEYTLKRVKAGENTISVTGNVLRDYLTDLFPILELGTSAKMLSIVPLMNGGGLFETGAGGSAPKHVQQFNLENHLRWDSLGEFLALAVSLEHYSEVNNNPKAKVLSETLDNATEKLLSEKKSPSRKAGELDNRGSHFYLAKFWAEALKNQNDDQELKNHFSNIADQFSKHESEIVAYLNEIQGNTKDIDGYYFPDPKKAREAMRPSSTFNTILESI